MSKLFHVKHLFLLAGLVILGVVALTIDVAESAVIAQRVGWGFLLILLVYAIEFIADVASWQLTFRSVPATPKWFYRLWQIKMVGEALNISLPAGHFGGEPVKAILLNRRLGLTFSEAIASLLLARTVITIALVAFLSIGFIAALEVPQVTDAERLAASIGLGAFCVAIVLFFLIQRLRLSSAAARMLIRGKWREKFEKMLAHLHALEDRLVHFYTKRPLRFAASLFLAFANWAIGAGTIYVTFYYLDHPVTFQEAWIVEAFAQLVRASTFFVPASLGAQESAFVLVVTAITGNPALGLAVAIVRRGREIVWIAIGLAIGWRLSAFGLKEKLQPDSE
ncbi:MAG: flippase-like domain-containing protein [Alphaproteobacteria bacterium]|nr:flippase-like domain-containing protein [Alphaproteobacteria bacterium]